MALTGLDNRLATFWLREGLLQGDGTRMDPSKKLRFPFYEANIVGILLHLREGGVSVETCKSIVGIYRDALAWADRLKLSDDDVRRIWNAKGPKDEGDVLELTLTLEFMANFNVLHSAELDERLRVMAAGINEEDFLAHREAFLQITHQPTELSYRVRPTFFWRGPDGWKARVSGNDLPTGPRQDGVFTTIAVDVDAIACRIWNPAAVTGQPSSIDLKPAR